MEVPYVTDSRVLKIESQVTTIEILQQPKKKKAQLSFEKIINPNLTNFKWEWELRRRKKKGSYFLGWEDFESVLGTGMGEVHWEKSRSKNSQSGNTTPAMAKRPKI